MRKIKYLVATLLIGFCAVNANPVLLNTAQKAAGNFYSQTYHTTATLTLAYTERSSDGQPVFYVFNVNNEGGFIIISAEDAGFPIIGSSNTGHYVIPTAGNNVDFWMNRRKSEIIAMRANLVKATPEVTQEWTGYINNIEKSTHNVTSSVAPLCTTTWDQPYPYNAMCPHTSLTGCVATAMAQIMKYWNYPNFGKSSWCYQDYTSYGYQENYGQLCAYFDTSNYVWTSMPNSVTTANKEVAKLMYDCGVSVDMDYSPSGSAALVIGGNPSAEYSYPTYFKYNPSTIKGALMTSYTTPGWNTLIETELNNGRPVQYQGTDGTLNEGHSWVCDGYNGSTLHMNWGWSGFDDGYYSATALAPAGSGYDFNKDIGALVGIEPDPTAIATVNNEVSINVYPNPSHGEFTFEIPTDLKNSQITIYNMLGQEVTGGKANGGSNNINIGNQPKGVYLYRLVNENGVSVSTGRLVVE